MEENEINELCASKIMKYNYRGHCEEAPEMPYVSPDSKFELILWTDEGGFSWDPANDITDTFKVLDKFEYYEHIGSEYGHTVIIKTLNGLHTHKDKSFGMAACKAALLAVIES